MNSVMKMIICKREVNKKVLKLPSLEQKVEDYALSVLDATSNDPWGPHGTHLVEIAQATRNYFEYQKIMTVIWKRIGDTGKNWRHVYKGLIVLEYLVAHGSERVIDEIREHAYQISILSNFQYVDSSGRDQGCNIRKKSQFLVALVNDKERIQEIRQKVLNSKDKYPIASSTYRSNSQSSTGSYDDDRYEGCYGNRYDDQNVHGRERERGSRDEERQGRGWHGDPRNRDSHRYNDSRNRSSEKEKAHLDEDDERSGRVDDESLDEGKSKFSEQSNGPPSYEEAVGQGPSPTKDDSGREGGTQSEAAHPLSPHETKALQPLSPHEASSPQDKSENEDRNVPDMVASPKEKVDTLGEFDLHDSIAAYTPAPNAVEMDLLGVFFDPVPSNSLALVPVTTAATSVENNSYNTAVDSTLGSGSIPPSSASNAVNQPCENPFGDFPFLATPSENGFVHQEQTLAHTASFQHPTTREFSSRPQHTAPNAEAVCNINSGGMLQALTYAPNNVANAGHPITTSEFPHPELPPNQQSVDILAVLFPVSGPTISPNISNVSLPSVTQESLVPQPLLLPSRTPQESSLSQSPISSMIQESPFSQPLLPAADQGSSFPQTPLPSVAHQSSFPQSPLPSMTHQSSFPQSPLPSPTHQPSFPPQSPLPYMTRQSLFPHSPHSSMTHESLFPQTPHSSMTHESSFSQAPLPPMAHGSFPQSPRPSMPHESLLPQPPATAQTGIDILEGILPLTVPSPNLASSPRPPASPQFSSGQLPNGTQTGMGIPGGHLPPSGSTAPLPSQASLPAQFGSQASPQGPIISQKSLPTSTSSLAPVPLQTGPPAKTELSKQKFEPKSTVWADTLSRGLVDLNISGPKTNPLSDIGIDFDSMHRKERREEKSAPAPAASTITMGKAMGTGSGFGRAGAIVLRPHSNHMTGSGMGMGMNMGMGGGSGTGMNTGMGGATGMGMNMGMGRGAGMGMSMGMGGAAPMGMGMNMGMGGAAPMGMGMGMGMGGGGAGMGGGMGMDQGMSGNGVGMGQGMGSGGMGMGPGMGGGGAGMGMGMGMGMGGYGGGMNQAMGMNMGARNMGMNMGMEQGVPMQPNVGMVQNPGMQGGYNPMMGMGGYSPQQSYGAYR
ncbi:hypothetical protein ACLOJK_011512 [Asimina triloba]